MGLEELEFLDRSVVWVCLWLWLWLWLWLHRRCFTCLAMAFAAR